MINKIKSFVHKLFHTDNTTELNALKDKIELLEEDVRKLKWKAKII